MKLDIDFAIRIMEAMEEADKSVIETWEELLDDVDSQDERYNYHCLMMNQAGLIKIWTPSNEGIAVGNPYWYVDETTPVAVDDRISDGTHDCHRVMAFPMMLTYDGHKFLETIRNEDARSRIKTFLTEQGLPFALSTVKEVGLKFLTG